ncbi:MAG: sigma-70 family RNA polymerase sigma factor [Muribaculaceae bacterium]|nr:sigma-70 family RNA polymerase sigma factor [Muribaculaceae bacterium]MDE6321977.1 sigma-70 family RNA polymerase sigma factor [Muribaculaceae bacterium]
MTDGEFKQLVLPRYSDMYAAAFVILRDKNDACDVVQEVIARLWERRKALEAATSLGSLCVVSVRNFCIDMLRKRHGRVSLDAELNLGYDVAGKSSTDDTANYNSLLKAISKVLSTMNGVQRNVLTLSLIGRLTIDEIQQATGETNVNVRQILSRGRRKLKEVLEDELQR